MCCGLRVAGFGLRVFHRYPVISQRAPVSVFQLLASSRYGFKKGLALD